MNKNEMRRQMLDGNNVAGDVVTELAELRKVQRNAVDAIETFTVTCSEVLTLICCE